MSARAHNECGGSLIYKGVLQKMLLDLGQPPILPLTAPLPSGPYNYLDPSSHRASLGMGVQLSKADNPSSRTVSLDLAYAATVIPQVKIAQRAGPLDPVGDFVAKAVIHSVNISLLHTF